MEYMQDSFAFPQQQVYYQAVPYTVYGQPHPQQLDDFYLHYPHAEYADFIQAGLMADEFEDAGEVSTRPRLTREQVEVLEAQFQAHPKPNSVVKRQLAMQTKLTLPRVANWFQNRRAKAKQQKKQEEFEITQSMGMGPGWQADGSNTDQSPTDPEMRTTPTSSTAHSGSPLKQASSDSLSSISPPELQDPSKEASWASLQRALAAAKAGQTAQQQGAQRQSQSTLSMPPPELPHHTMSMQLPLRYMQNAASAPTESWASAQDLNNPPFDFGFGQQEGSTLSTNDSGADCSPHDMTQHLYALPDAWQDSLATPTGLPQHQLASPHLIHSPELQMPAYSGSRRGSAADDLTAGFGTFALASSSPHPMAGNLPSGSMGSSDGQLDIAARRKRPRPAALTSAALRSRSYGALTSASPTFRTNMTPPAHTVRHVKSTGHNLNARYSGIRKASSAQRSPMNFSTFADAEAFNRLMAQQAGAQNGTQSVTTPSAPLMSPGLVISNQVSPVDDENLYIQKVEMASHYQLPATQHLTLSTTSPPTTPFMPDYMNQGRQHQNMPPVSAPAQYASFPDQTPPHSAGPLTNSSWSDAPLTSPELPNFPPVTYIPSLNYPQSTDSFSQFQHFVLTSDAKSDVTVCHHDRDQKQTEFLIQEFPNQKEEHAHVAQQLAQQKPRNYVFANSAPSDYDQL